MALTRTRGALAAAAAVAAPLTAVLAAAGPAHAADSVTVTVTTLHFATTGLGPNKDTACDVVGDLYVPSTATAATPAPAIVTTNGFGGDKNDQAGTAQFFARQGYVVLSYTGLGFGPAATSPSSFDPSDPNGSGCKIELDSPQWDGRAGAELVDWLGGGTTFPFAYLDAKHTLPYDGTPPVLLDAPGDPRVGMIGGSYGGEIQFAVAAVSQKVDAIIPEITWNDLSYSLAPNDTGFQRRATNPAAVTYTDSDPGTEKAEWVSLFFGLGIADGVEGASADPTRNVGCPNFDNQACTAKAQLDSTGFADQATLDFARGASVESYLNQIHVPTLLAQGQGDTLFNLQEATATYAALKARGVPVQMVWQSWGHSSSSPVPGELSLTATSQPADTYEGRLFTAWFAKYLEHDTTADTGAEFQYYRDWVPYSGHGPDTAQYASASSYPAATTPQTLALSGTGDLVADPAAVQAGSASFAVPAAGAPTSYTETSALDQSQPVRDTPGTFAAFTSAPLTAPADQVGSPTLTLHLSAPVHAGSQSVSPAGKLVLFAKLYDVAPDGTVTLTHRLIAPVRVDDVSKPVTVELPAVVHRYPAGHRLEVVVAAGDAAYKGNDTAGPVQIVNDPAAANTLTIPFVNEGGAQFGSPGTDVPEAPAAVLLPLAALLAVGGAVALRRRVNAA